MTTHHVRLTGNRVSGAVSLVSPEPVKAAATGLLPVAALVAATKETESVFFLPRPRPRPGASPDDVLHVDAGEVNVLPMTQASVLRSRPTPGRTEMMRTMLGLPPKG